MINTLTQGWRSLKLCLALHRGDEQQARKILQEIRRSNPQLSGLEKLFQDKLEADYELKQKQKEIIQLKHKLKRLSQLDSLPSEFYFDEKKPIIPTQNIIDHITQKFNLIDQDYSFIQCTGIDLEIFSDFELNLAVFIEDEFKQMSQRKNFEASLTEAVQDLNGLKSGEDPKYSFELSPYVYFLRYFLTNVYGAYLAWFLIYKTGLLPKHLKILDIAAGPGTMIYGLDLFLRSSHLGLNSSEFQIAYYSLEKQAKFQYRGLQFWRRYVEQLPQPTNAYFRFDTCDLLGDSSNFDKMPKQFFNFIIISHCFFYQSQIRQKANTNFQYIFNRCLQPDGYVLFIVQDKKLFKGFNLTHRQDYHKGDTVMQSFLEEIGLKLVWYKYLTSTGMGDQMTPAEFGKFAREKLPRQNYISPLCQDYLSLKHDLNYTIDDYIILAQRK